jgi:hypothetical protein
LGKTQPLRRFLMFKLESGKSSRSAKAFFISVTSIGAMPSPGQL